MTQNTKTFSSPSPSHLADAIAVTWRPAPLGSTRDTGRAMSDAISEAIRAGHDAFNRGDYESWSAAYDEDVECHDLGDTPDTGIFHGHAGIRVWLAKLQEAWGEGFPFEPQSVMRGDDVVVVDTRAIGV